jgi:hypothetical protein
MTIWGMTAQQAPGSLAPQTSPHLNQARGSSAGKLAVVLGLVIVVRAVPSEELCGWMWW